MAKFVLFPDPLNSRCELRFDNHTVSVGVPYEHSTHRLGQAIEIPSGTPEGNGVQLFITNSDPSKGVINQRGTLWYQDGHQTFPFPEGDCFIWFDDFHLPTVVIVNPTPPIPPPSDRTPEQIIADVYATGLYNLTTHDGCGVFTEACCSALHDNHSVSWGHIKKFSGQEQYNGHAIDAIQLLNSMPDCDRGVYDIIVQSQAPDAHPGFNRQGEPNQLLWYYPA